MNLPPAITLLGRIEGLDLIIYRKVATFSTKQPFFAFVVESEEYAETMKILHKQLWDKSRPADIDV